MTLSMTGYGRARQNINGREITVEIKSVNSRYFEYSSRIPRSILFIDDKVKKLINQKISRGKIDVSIQMQNINAPEVKIRPNIELAKSYYDAIITISNELYLSRDVNINSLLRFNDIFMVNSADIDEDALWQDIKDVVELAIESFMQMRIAEGDKLKQDILSRLGTIQNTVSVIEKSSEERVGKYFEKLTLRLQNILSENNINIDEQRILTETAIFADKTAVDEETVRLRSHIKQYEDILQLDEPVGRKLDFLTQELNREINTIGSKCQDVQITRLVVDTKSEIEKIREQVQNIE